MPCAESQAGIDALPVKRVLSYALLSMPLRMSVGEAHGALGSVVHSREIHPRRIGKGGRGSKVHNERTEVLSKRWSGKIWPGVNLFDPHDSTRGVEDLVFFVNDVGQALSARHEPAVSVEIARAGVAVISKARPGQFAT